MSDIPEELLPTTRRALAARLARGQTEGRAPSMAPACSNDGSMPVMYDSVSKKVNGNPVMMSERNTPQ